MRYSRDGYSVEAAIRKGRDLPLWAQDPPDLELNERFYLDSFWDLHSERLHEQGPIPWSKTLLYSNEREFDQVLKDCFFEIIKYVDRQYLKYLADQRKTG